MNLCGPLELVRPINNLGFEVFFNQPDLFGGLISVHYRHLNVHEDDIEAVGGGEHRFVREVEHHLGREARERVAHAERELRQRADELAEADRRKDEFLAMLAHELRNPLAPILATSEWLRRRPDAVGAEDGGDAWQTPDDGLRADRGSARRWQSLCRYS